MISMSTDVGNLRETNQDRVAYKKINEDELLCVLCDGMGGHKAGEVAAQMTSDYIIDHFSEHEAFLSPNDIKMWLNSLIIEANNEVYKKGSDNEEYSGMGTTVVIAYVKDHHIYISHVGDSRAYSFKDHILHQLTVDDTLVNALLKGGYITKEQAVDHPQKNVLIQAVGVTDLLKVSFLDMPCDFDAFLLCSDGLYNSLTDEQMTAILESDDSVSKKTDELIKQANIHGGYDNISVILLEGGDNHE